MATLRSSVTERFRDLLARRLFLDREPGVLLVWVEADRHDVASLVPQVEALHPATRFAVQTSGVAVAVRMTARDDELAAIEQLYVDAR
jgi:hypothetical protein